MARCQTHERNTKVAEQIEVPLGKASLMYKDLKDKKKMKKKWEEKKRKIWKMEE